MKSSMFKRLVVAVAVVAVTGVGTVPPSGAAVVSTAEVLADESRRQQIDLIESYLVRDEVAALLEERGVAPQAIAARLDALTDEELAVLKESIDDAVAGGDALGVIGAVFLVLLILELVGVTDIFKAI